MTDIPDLLQRYADYISAGDKEGILSLYAPDATCEIPVGGPIKPAEPEAPCAEGTCKP